LRLAESFFFLLSGPGCRLDTDASHGLHENFSLQNNFFFPHLCSYTRGHKKKRYHRREGRYADKIYLAGFFSAIRVIADSFFFFFFSLALQAGDHVQVRGKTRAPRGSSDPPLPLFFFFRPPATTRPPGFFFRRFFFPSLAGRFRRRVRLRRSDSPSLSRSFFLPFPCSRASASPLHPKRRRFFPPTFKEKRRRGEGQIAQGRFFPDGEKTK